MRVEHARCDRRIGRDDGPGLVEGRDVEHEDAALVLGLRRLGQRPGEQHDLLLDQAVDVGHVAAEELLQLLGSELLVGRPCPEHDQHEVAPVALAVGRVGEQQAGQDAGKGGGSHSGSVVHGADIPAGGHRIQVRLRGSPGRP